MMGFLLPCGTGTQDPFIIQNSVDFQQILFILFGDQSVWGRGRGLRSQAWQWCTSWHQHTTDQKWVTWPITSEQSAKLTILPAKEGEGTQTYWWVRFPLYLTKTKSGNLVVSSPHPSVRMRIKGLGEGWDMEKGALGTGEKEGSTAGRFPQFLFFVHGHT